MAEYIEFETVQTTDPVTGKKSDAVAVIRNGRKVALLPEAARLQRAQALPIDEIEEINNNFTEIMEREPTLDEKEFWQAILDFKRGQDKNPEN